MSTEFKWFKAENTGKVEKYPARFAGRPGLVEIDPSGCVNCGQKTENEAAEDEDTQEFVITDWSDNLDAAQEDEDN